MAIVLLVRNKVKDFDTWKKHFDSGAEFVKQNGVIASRVLRDMDDPNMVIVQHEFADADAINAFKDLMDSEAFREGPVKLGGVILETMEVWIGEEVS